MKFPMRDRPFKGVQFTPQELANFEKLAALILEATIEEHERFVTIDNRVLHKKQWKGVKTRDNITVYKRTGREPVAPGQGPRLVQPAESYHWYMPKMLAVGTLAGALDDIMYGIVTPDAASIVVKTSYVHDTLIDSHVLHTVRGAIRQDPFQYTGIKWFAKSHPVSFNTIFWPRDFVFIEATGLRALPNGGRMGYHVIHSIEHPLCGDLESLGMVRGKTSSCCLYFQRDPGTVEVYQMTFVDPGGTPPEGPACMSAANTMIGQWQSTWCSQNKVLSWLLENDRARRHFRTTINCQDYSSTRLISNRCCQVCDKSIGSFRSVKTCQLCTKWVCSKCRIGRKLSSSNEKLELFQRVVEVCKRCIAHVAIANTFEVAVQQYVGFDDEQHDSSKSVGDVIERGREDSTESNTTMPGSLTSLGNFGRIPSWRDDTESEPRSRAPSDEVVMETLDDWEQQQRKLSEALMAKETRSVVTVPVPSEVKENPIDPQANFYNQVQLLWLTAEETYRMTAVNGEMAFEARRIKSST